jgi:hypothetical protein
VAELMRYFCTAVGSLHVSWNSALAMLMEQLPARLLVQRDPHSVHGNPVRSPHGDSVRGSKGDSWMPITSFAVRAEVVHLHDLVGLLPTDLLRDRSALLLGLSRCVHEQRAEDQPRKDHTSGTDEDRARGLVPDVTSVHISLNVRATHMAATAENPSPRRAP